MDIEWEDPPPGKARGKGLFRDDPRVVAMRGDPKRWLVWDRGRKVNSVGYLKQRYGVHGFEFVARNTRPGDGYSICDVYARFVGDES